jgi:cysteine desulfurase
VIYLDNSATTMLDEAVLEEMLPWMRHEYGNASSIYALGRRARVAVEKARTEVAGLINAHPAELTFTSGGTESNNSVLMSACRESGLVDRVVVGSIEHHAVLAPSEELASQGYRHHVLGVDAEGRYRPEDVASFNDARTLISLMHANNETGTIQPLAQLRAAVPDALLHTDAVQTLGKIRFDVQQLGVDFASFSAHKIHGPKGVGAMFIRKGIDFKAHQVGGGQERNRRAGTEPVALIVGFAAALRRSVSELDQRGTQMQAQIDTARAMILELIPDVRVNTPRDGSLPNILNVSFRDADRLDGESILQLMDMRGIAVSNGSACVSGSLQPSHVLSAMGLSDAEARAAVRISVSQHTTNEEIATAVQTLASILRELRESTR